MCPVREPRSSTEPSARPLKAAALAGWLAYVAIYAVLFELQGAGLSIAIRAALANGLPDGLLAIAVVGLARRDPRRQATVGPLLLALAGAGKWGLFWIEARLVRGEPSFDMPAGILGWQVFLSVLVYVIVAATTRAWLAARRLREEEAHAARAEALRA